MNIKVEDAVAHRVSWYTCE